MSKKKVHHKVNGKVVCGTRGRLVNPDVSGDILEVTCEACKIKNKRPVFSPRALIK